MMTNRENPRRLQKNRQGQTKDNLDGRVQIRRLSWGGGGESAKAWCEKLNYSTTISLLDPYDGRKKRSKICEGYPRTCVRRCASFGKYAGKRGVDTYARVCADNATEMSSMTHKTHPLHQRPTACPESCENSVFSTLKQCSACGPSTAFVCNLFRTFFPEPFFFHTCFVLSNCFLAQFFARPILRIFLMDLSEVLPKGFS